jgi:hypothetical protein
MDQLVTVTLYSRPGCHLCDQMKTVVARVAREFPLELQEIDISSDPALEEQFGLEIPVLLVAGRKAAKYRITDLELVRILSARTREPTESGNRVTG